jgi:hypothetical protein
MLLKHAGYLFPTMFNLDLSDYFAIRFQFCILDRNVIKVMLYP